MLFNFGFRRLCIIIQLLVALQQLFVPPASSEKVKTTISTKECDYEVEKCKRNIAPSDAFCKDLVNQEHTCDPGIQWEPPGDGEGGKGSSKIIGVPFEFPPMPTIRPPPALPKSTEQPAKTTEEAADDSSQQSESKPTESPPQTTTSKMMADIFAKIFVVETTTGNSLGKDATTSASDTGEPEINDNQTEAPSSSDADADAPSTSSSQDNEQSSGDQGEGTTTSIPKEGGGDDNAEQESSPEPSSAGETTEGAAVSEEPSNGASGSTEGVPTMAADSATEPPPADSDSTSEPTSPKTPKKGSKDANKNVEELESIKSKLETEFGFGKSFFPKTTESTNGKGTEGSEEPTNDDDEETTETEVKATTAKSHSSKRNRKQKARRESSSSESSEEEMTSSKAPVEIESETTSSKDADNDSEATSPKPAAETESIGKQDVKAPDLFASNFESLFEPKTSTQKPKSEGSRKKSESKSDDRPPKESKLLPALADSEILPASQPSMLIRKKTAPTKVEPPSKVYERKVESLSNKVRNDASLRKSGGQDRRKDVKAMKDELKFGFGSFGKSSGGSGGGSGKKSSWPGEAVPLPLPGMNPRKAAAKEEDVFPSIFNKPASKRVEKTRQQQKNSKFGSFDDFEEMDSIEDMGDNDDGDDLGGFLSGVL